MSPSPSPDQRIDDVLTFWFDEITEEQRFRRDDAFDHRIAERFADLYAEVVAGRCSHWADHAEGALALLIVLDQFSRNLYRDDPKAFAQDQRARALTRDCMTRGLDRQVEISRRMFFYMPLMHSEDPRDHLDSVRLFRDLNGGEPHFYAERHKEIIDRFGRYPHRNAVLGRTSTAEETAFLDEPFSSF